MTIEDHAVEIAVRVELHHLPDLLFHRHPREQVGDAVVEREQRVRIVVQAHGLSGSIDLLALVACRDARHLFDTDARILSIDGVERTETSLAMGEVIPFRVAGLIGLARRES